MIYNFKIYSKVDGEKQGMGTYYFAYGDKYIGVK